MLVKHVQAPPTFQATLDSRIVVEQANGFLAPRRDIGVDEAFRLLRAHSREHGVPLTDIARQVLDGTTDPTLLGPRA
ncbi:ANTAR domain-containing protein [Streptomyces sp. NBC_00825]|uniref:ANTAR domain-containing protein n=1 Tax=unclassified Streptomyces TaxID=2593676 RepID=UPI00224EDAF9|nr:MULTISPECIES: ANTAR domain-containing protein [unclassified Streptomyces]WTB59521.1 ANTAR domain-containing protein [Streptomyces sp. NBC_00826]WTH95896.1 ANTAR domain-containing protein [Streptomyces sp. NBC_00825]WTI04617.1 ANTAR domain-containing protein [Streptomyces sp. NBC_00822]MCX4869531.1 ANTAR domain-containing protein [Streptomyces sp. NBC_00906]MCX4900770.1 ANTAR domain-containing protein [Streptomyces sp. NBC_00892]